MTGSSPGCQRSMLSGEPSDEPKNRLEVLKEKPSRDGAAARRASGACGTPLRSSCGLASSDRHFELRQRRRAQRGLKFGIERRGLNGRRRLGGLCALDQRVGVRGILDGRRALGWTRGLCRRRRRHDKAVALQRAIDRREIGRLITRRRRNERIARHRTRDVDALMVEACQPIGRGLRRGRSNRTAEAERRDLNGAGRGEHAASASAPPRPAGGPATMQYPDIRSRSASMRRRKDRGRRTQSARPSAGYATQTWIRSRNAYTIELQYIRAIRPFLLVSNLGCRGVNRRGLRVTRKKSPAFSRSHEKCW